MVKQKKKKGTNNDQQNTTQKTKDQGTQTPLKNGDPNALPLIAREDKILKMLNIYNCRWYYHKGLI